MKKSFLKLATAVSLGCAIATPAVAVDNHQFQITPLVGYNFFDNDLTRTYVFRKRYRY